MRREIKEFIDKEAQKRQQSWRVEYGEEAKIHLESKVNTLLQLSNMSVVVAAQNAESHMIEVYDTSTDFEKASTVYTIHTAPIVCLAEHRKLLLTGSLDCTVGFWDMFNNF